MTGTMTAARFYEPGKPLRVEDVPVPRPAADEVLVRVRATGLCGSDVHIAVEGITPTPYQPIVLGHEIAGTVAAVGEAVRGWRVRGQPHLAAAQRSLYPYAFSVAEEAGIVARLKNPVANAASAYRH